MLILVEDVHFNALAIQNLGNSSINQKGEVINLHQLKIRLFLYYSFIFKADQF